MILDKLIHITKQPLLLPFYHLVSDAPPLFVKELYKPKTVQQFKDDLDVFLTYYQPISLEDVIKYNRGELELKKPSFHITFDDGLANFYHVIAPILKAKNIPATVFLNTDFIDNKELFYRYKASLLLNNSKFKIQNLKFNPLKVDFKNSHLLNSIGEEVGFDIKEFLKKKKPYLTLEQIKELQKQGFTFGAHSRNHPLYKDISFDEQLQQTKESLQWIKTNLHEKYSVFSFPFHDIDVSKQFFNNIEKHVDLTFGTSGFKKDDIPTNLHRLDMEKSLKMTKKFLTREHTKCFIKKITGQYRIKRV